MTVSRHIVRRQSPEPIVIVDLGGDQGMFHSVRIAAMSAGRKFRFFSLDPDDDSDYFDPFQALKPGRGYVLRLCTMLIRAFNLDYGLFYGGDYFTAQNTVALLKVARKLTQDRRNNLPLTIEDLVHHLEKTKTRDADQIRTSFMFLNEYPQLKPHLALSADRCIDIRRSVDNGEVLYFFMPAIAESISARLIAGLVLYTLQQIAERRMREGLPKKNCYGFIDEVSEVAGRSFEKFINQCRKTGINLLMASQHADQLRSRDTDLRRVISSACRLKFYFNCQGQDEMDEMLALSATTRIVLNGKSHSVSTGLSEGTGGGTSWSVSRGRTSSFDGASYSQGSSYGGSSNWTRSESSGESFGSSTREEVAPALEVNEILDVDGHVGRCFMLIRTGTGHTQPIAVDTKHVISREMYKELESQPLPQRPPPDPHAVSHLLHQSRSEEVRTRLECRRNEARQKALQELWSRIDSPEKTTDP